MWELPTANGGGSLQAELKRREAGAVLGVTFWRPMPPIGYAVLGHCATRDADQPSFQVSCRSSPSRPSCCLLSRRTWHHKSVSQGHSITLGALAVPI